jgi:hypothetical protein
VEIMDDAQPVQSHPFAGPTAFMIGNEAILRPALVMDALSHLPANPPRAMTAKDGYDCLQGHGLSEKQVAMCDAFVYIPQYGDGTASLNVTVATSIVLQHFAEWAGYREHGREGQKFMVGERPQRTAARGDHCRLWST